MILAVLWGISNVHINSNTIARVFRNSTGIFLITCSGMIQALNLPEEQYSLTCNSYSGNNTSIDATRFSVRNTLNADLSFGADVEHAKRYDDSFETSMSAKPYEENQNSLSLHGDYLHENSLLKLSFDGSNKNDYEANQVSFDIFQENLNSLSTFNLGYSNGWDTLQAYGSTASDDIQHHRMRLGLKQVLSSNWMGQIGYEYGQDDGALGNPYIPAVLKNSYVPALYPNNRSSQNASLSLMQYVDKNTLAKIQFRYVKDDWGVHAQALTLNYAAPLRNPYWHLDSHVRFYRQSAAFFYADNASQFDEFLSHDPSLAQFEDIELGMHARVDLSPWFNTNANKIYAHMAYAMIFYDYTNYTQMPATDKLFSFKANALQSYITVTY